MKRREDNLVVMWHQTILEKRLKVACDQTCRVNRSTPRHYDSMAAVHRRMAGEGEEKRGVGSVIFTRRQGGTSHTHHHNKKPHTVRYA